MSCVRYTAAWKCPPSYPRNDIPQILLGVWLCIQRILLDIFRLTGTILWTCSYTALRLDLLSFDVDEAIVCCGTWWCTPCSSCCYRKLWHSWGSKSCVVGCPVHYQVQKSPSHISLHSNRVWWIEPNNVPFPFSWTFLIRTLASSLYDMQVVSLYPLLFRASM